MEDNELIHLRNTKAELEKLIKIQKKLLTKSYDEEESNFLSWKYEVEINIPPENVNYQVTTILEDLMGFKFQNIVKTRNTYKAEVVMEYLNFEFELSIDVKDESHFVVTNISIKLKDLQPCFSKELTDCLDFCIENKNFQVLMLSTLLYNNKFSERRNILDKLTKKFVTIKADYIFEDGGLLLFINSTKNPKLIHCKCQWSIKFSKQHMFMMHSFRFENADTDDFVEKHASLLNKFTDDDYRSIQRNWTALYTLVNKNSLTV